MAITKSDSSAKEIELIDNVARKIIDTEMEIPALWLLEIIKPICFIGGELSFFYLAPFLPFLEDKGYTFLDTFEKRKNIERLIKTVERLEKEKAKEKKKTQQPSIWSKLKNKLFFRARENRGLKGE